MNFKKIRGVKSHQYVIIPIVKYPNYWIQAVCLGQELPLGKAVPSKFQWCA